MKKVKKPKSVILPFTSVGVYYGVAMKTSTNYIRHTFQRREDAEACIAKKKCPKDWTVVEC